MSIQSKRQTITRIQNEISRLRQSYNNEDKKIIQKRGVINRARAALLRTTSGATLKTRAREIEMLNKEILSIEKQKENIEKQINGKNDQLIREQTQLQKLEEQEQKKQSDAANKRQIELEKAQKKQIDLVKIQSAQLTRPTTASSSPVATQNQQYDVFICHASEDKEYFVRPLAKALTDKKLRVFYDEESIGWGDGLRQKIDSGLANSKYGIVVLSTYFISKPWPKRELDGLTQQELVGSSKVLPILHHITIDKIREYSPPLADKKALNSSIHSIDEIVNKFMKFMENK